MVRGLDRLRFSIEKSLGRRYPETAHPFRNAFQRDRDRIIHARAFRRLENKTQVFSAPLSDHFRNRLTHTIEVAQIARTVVCALRLEESLTEALALGHDIGHPPFAHAGEEELDRRMRAYGGRFDHNSHALRIVEEFEQRYARFPGLNLTFEVREGIAKHSRDFERGENEALEEYLPGLRPPLEAQLIDLADEIAYNTADFDDGYSARLVDLAEARESVPRLDELCERAETQFPGATEKERFNEVLRQIVDALVTGLVEGTIAAAAESGAASVEDVREFPTRLARFTEEAREINGGLKRFLHERVYGTPALLEERRISMRRIGELFEFFIAHPERLPEGYGERLESAPVHRVVCDYVAGMTDRFFLRTYEELLGG